jgi:hypothetical protein
VVLGNTRATVANSTGAWVDASITVPEIFPLAFTAVWANAPEEINPEKINNTILSFFILLVKNIITLLTFFRQHWMAFYSGQTANLFSSP